MKVVDGAANSAIPASDVLGAQCGLPGGESLEGRSASSSWRYASVGASADSDTYSGLLASVSAEAEGGLAVGLGQKASTAAGGDSPAAANEQHPTTDSGGRQLWSPSKRPQPQQHFYNTSTTGGFKAAGSSGLQGGLGISPGMAAPPGMDAVSYAAGERAAFMLAFQQALPGQQALGQLFSAVDALHSRLEEEAGLWRQLQLGASKTAGMVETAIQRLDAVEHTRLPQLQEKADAAASRPQEQLLELLGGLQQVVALLAQQRHLLTQQQQQMVAAAAGAQGGPRRPRFGASAGALHWLLLAAAGYGQSILSKADVAALLLSRKILLGPTREGHIGDQDQAGGSMCPVSRQLSTALSVMLFVGSVEAAWQAQHRLLRPLPTFAQRATAPLQLGLKVARGVVWSAAIVLAAAQTRASCHAASDSLCDALESAAGVLRLPAWAGVLPGWSQLSFKWKESKEADAACSSGGGTSGSGLETGGGAATACCGAATKAPPAAAVVSGAETAAVTAAARAVAWCGDRSK